MTPEADTDRVPMTFEERNTWLAAILVPLSTLGYLAVVIPRLLSRPVGEVAWAGPMLWSIGAVIVASIIGSIISAIMSAIVSREARMETDVRDRDINRHGDRIAQAITGFGAAAVLVLAMLRADQFWIGNALFLIGAVGTTWGAVAKIRAYRGGFHG
ncbi:hypothetical protein [Catellatospora bangladeshensis]|uniref:DUF2178 domain-containing protein n=1 Tax=Catellatospora bangladeshensis TaxID=310355 RepID=A0A8J3NJR5_9ACTN|nr:hypothetical protein [Catellatospora bangladeshensis]GIF80720.1 hypothetical protein Cba03nite_20690 [Catellatospora bangladeshensis]